jgi:hypothetical protein
MSDRKDNPATASSVDPISDRLGDLTRRVERLEAQARERGHKTEADEAREREELEARAREADKEKATAGNKPRRRLPG